MSSAPVVTLSNLSFTYPGASSPVFKDFSLSVGASEFVAIVGGSGVGKSTILRIASGLIKPHSGTVDIAVKKEPSRRRRALVFQDGRLMPWRTVAQNIALGLEGLELPASEKERRVEDVLSLVNLSDKADRWPHQLSGGQVQRIGIARALAVKPDILLMDEPFSAVDAMTRRHLQTELVRIWQKSGTAIIFVTHDIDEAAFLADRIIVMGDSPARIVNETIVPVDRDLRRDSQDLSRYAEGVAGALDFQI
ncbi:MAG: ABC transporter ATP-binding protein [Alphaproteobacteria bacterium]|nr:ABC transporter ATP-binding protein [Alphaproteobacteria bacterium]